MKDPKKMTWKKEGNVTLEFVQDEFGFGVSTSGGWAVKIEKDHLIQIAKEEIPLDSPIQILTNDNFYLMSYHTACLMMPSDLYEEFILLIKSAYPNEFNNN